MNVFNYIVCSGSSVCRLTLLSSSFVTPGSFEKIKQISGHDSPPPLPQMHNKPLEVVIYMPFGDKDNYIPCINIRFMLL